MTSFRIVAVATAGADLFGTGEATIRTTRDLVIHAGLPPTMREGDRFDAHVLGAECPPNPSRRSPSAPKLGACQGSDDNR